MFKFFKRALTALGLLVITITAAKSDSLSQFATLSLQEAIDLALKNNYELQIVKIDSSISESNHSAGAAGILPSANLSLLSSSATSAGQLDRITLGVGVNWTVFDGFKMFTSYAKLALLDSLGVWKTKAAVNELIARVTLAYADVQRQKDQLLALEDALQLSHERRSLDSSRMAVGSASQFDWLRSSADLNEDSSAYLKQQTAYEDSKTQLLILLGLAQSGELQEFDNESGPALSDSLRIKVLTRNEREKLNELWQTQNFELSMQKVSVRVAEKDVSLTNSAHWPRIDVGLGYDIQEWNWDNGLKNSDRDIGWRYGVSAVLPLFDGFNSSRQVRNAKLNLVAKKYEMKQRELELQSRWNSAQRSYQNSISRLNLEENNLDVAHQSLDLARARHRIGVSSAFELREAQTDYLAAQSRYTEARYEAMAAETDLFLLSGSLAKRYADGKISGTMVN